MMLACSINNCIALKMLVRPSICVGQCADSAAMVTECSQLFSFSIYLPFFPLLLPKLKQGAKVCVQNRLGHYPIHAAAFAGARKALEVILTNGTERTSIFFFFFSLKSRVSE